MYRGSRDGWNTSHFHNKCDNQGATIALVKDSEGRIYGGYTSVSWDNTSGFKKDNQAFLFSVDKKLKFKIKLD